MAKISNKDRFFNKVNKNGNNGCWEWAACITKFGYGKFTYTPSFKIKKTISAHRFALMLEGVELDPELVIDHICKNRKCVNPEHLRQVTHRQNSIDFSDSPSAMMAKRTHCPKCNCELIPENLVQWIYKKHGWRHCRKCVVSRNRDLKYKNHDAYKERVRENYYKNLEKSRRVAAEWARNNRCKQKNLSYQINVDKWLVVYG